MVLYAPFVTMNFDPPDVRIPYPISGRMNGPNGQMPQMSDCCPECTLELDELRERNQRLEDRLEELSLLYIEAMNPGIDMDKVRESRAMRQT